MFHFFRAQMQIWNSKYTKIW
uniref:Uncharacterized protein n=1 Tax=Arundo donax TaxID=35708 RepID=A0A0A9E370_ARUDO